MQFGDILVSFDPADSSAVFESEKITALSNLFWCRFSRRSLVRMAAININTWFNWDRVERSGCKPDHSAKVKKQSSFSHADHSFTI